MHAIILAKDMDSDLVRRVNRLIDTLDLRYDPSKNIYQYMGECFNTIQEAIVSGNFTGVERCLIGNGTFQVMLPGECVYFISGYNLDNGPVAVLVPGSYDDDDTVSITVSSCLINRSKNGTVTSKITLSESYEPDV